MSNSNDYFLCPHCGTELPPNAAFCRQCGSSDDSGWNESDSADNDYMEDDFDYDEFVQREFGNQQIDRNRSTLTVAVVLLLLVALVAFSLPSC